MQTVFIGGLNMDPIKIAELSEQLSTTLIQKNHDYGNSYEKTVNEYGDMIIPLRIDDKVNRLKTLLSGTDSQVRDESVADTLLDIAGYALLGAELWNRRLGE